MDLNVPRTESADPYPLLIKQLLHTPMVWAPDQEIVYRDRVRLSYRSFRERVGRLASALAALGVKPGDTVAVMDWDSHRYLEAYFAVPMMGAVLHHINVRLSPEQVLYTMNHAEDKVVLVHTDFLPLMAALRSRLDTVAHLVLMTDDGEPGGTAGRPILAAIEGQGLDFVLVVVTRHFGGIKLGAGGLVRAYGNTAAECLRQAARIEVLPRLQVAVEVPFEAVGALYEVLARFAGAGGPLSWGQEVYLPTGQRVEVDLIAHQWPRLQKALEDATRGRVRFLRHGVDRQIR